MKHWSSRFFVLLMVVPFWVRAHVAEQAHSFFMPRPISMHTLLTAGTMFTRPAPDKNESTLSFEHTAFYHQSTDGISNAPYFLEKEKPHYVLTRVSWVILTLNGLASQVLRGVSISRICISTHHDRYGVSACGCSSHLEQCMTVCGWQ